MAQSVPLWRYATTESKLANLKNTATLAAQQIGDELTPTFQKLIDGAKELIEQLMSIDSSTRQTIIKIAAVAAAAVTATVALVDYASGAKKAREALASMKGFCDTDSVCK